MSHDSLANYLQTSFSLKRHHRYNFDEMDNLTPFEMNVYISMLDAALKEEERKARETT